MKTTPAHIASLEDRVAELQELADQRFWDAETMRDALHSIAETATDPWACSTAAKALGR